MDGWRNATRVCLAMLGVALAVLFATGVWLWSNYVPAADESWVRVTHRIASVATIALGVVILVVMIGRRVRAGERGVVAAVGVAVTALTASFTGYLLAWDQLALSAVSVGTRRGISTVFDADVKYILIGSREVSVGTYRFWSISHVVFGLLVALAAWLAWSRTRAQSSEPADPELVVVGQE